MLALSESNCLVFRNETGRFWTGKVLHKALRQVTLGNAQMIPCGLAVGSSDLIGLTSTGQFFAIEVKTKTGRASKEQLAFIEAVRANGGLAGIARTEQEALDIIRG
jgi:hypothetical protein